MADVNAVYEDGAPGYIIEPHQQVNQGGFPHSGRSYDGNHLPAFYLGIQSLKQRLLRCVGEVYIFKCHVSFHMLRRCLTVFVLRFFLLV